MKAVILAGGYGSRLMEETELRMKPMIEVGSRPILRHIMSIYAAHGIQDFVVCLGYRGYMSLPRLPWLHESASVTVAT